MDSSSRNSFGKDVLRLVFGTAGAQALTALAAPLLTRLYTPENFGLLAVYASMAALVGVVASLRYELAIPLPEDGEEAAHVVAVCLVLVGIVTILSSVIAIFFGGYVCSLLGAPTLAGYLWLLPIGVLFTGIYTALNYWNIRTKSFGVIAKTRWKQALSSIVIQLGGFKLGAVTLLFGQVAGQSAGALSLLRPAASHPAFRKLSLGSMWGVAHRYRKFPLFSTGEGLANTASLQLPPLMFATFFGADWVGIYALTVRILQLPMSLVGNSIGQVFLSRAPDARRKGMLDSLVLGLHTKLARFGLPPTLILILGGPDLFAFAFGEQWRLAGLCARWLAPWLYLVFVASPLSTLFSVVERQGQGLAFQVLILAIRCGAIALGASSGDFLMALKLFGVASALCWGGFLVWLGRIVGIPALSMLRPTASALLISVACVFPLILVPLLGWASQVQVLIACAASSLIILSYYYRIFLATRKP